MNDDQPVTYGLYEAFAAACDVNLTEVRIYHDLFVARDDEHARQIIRQKSDGLRDVMVTRLMDVEPRG